MVDQHKKVEATTQQTERLSHFCHIFGFTACFVMGVYIAVVFGLLAARLLTPFLP